MPRPKNAKNIAKLQARNTIPTSSDDAVLHLAKIQGSPLAQFITLLKHQENYLTWIDSRHQMLQDARKQLQQRLPKSKTYKKHSWYSEQLVLLASINAFEKYYKSMIVSLCDAVRSLVRLDDLKAVHIDPRHLFSDLPNESVVAVYYESKIYHSIEAIDEATYTLIGKKCYNVHGKKNAERADLTNRGRCIAAVFQIRHTLSHNNGYVTSGDAIKMSRFDFEYKAGTVVDPTKDNLSYAITDFMREEATRFFDWLLVSTIEFVKDRKSELGIHLDDNIRRKLHALFDLADDDVSFE